MVQSVELVVDEELDRAVREEWAILLDAGLPSQARHTGASNAPHVTLGVAGTIDADAEAALREHSYGIGGELRLGGLLVFMGRRFVLSRVVVPSETLVETHRHVHGCLASMPDVPENVRPGRWTPHVTLAHRLDAAELAAALELLADRPRELTGTVSAARRWDGDARTTWDIGATP